MAEICPVCGAEKQKKKCQICEGNNFQFDKARSVFHFNKIIQNLIHDLKYDEMTKVAKFLGEQTASYLNRMQPFDRVDLIAPVPLHKVRKRERCFNQSELLTQEISELMNWKHKPHLILRNRFTKTQTKLDRKDRQKNVSGAFTLNIKFDIQGKNILLVDDVFTTGATVNSISSLLKNNGAAKVYVLTIARA